MEFSQLVETSERVRSTSKKKEKVNLIALFLRRVGGEEISLAAHFLAGTLPMGKLGIGYATIEAARHSRKDPSFTPSISGIGVGLQELSAPSGPGSQAEKRRILEQLFSSLTAKETDFLAGLITGEIRQGALTGLVLDAVAQAASLAPEGIRRAYMFSGDAGKVARAALEEGAAGLERYGPRLFQPVSPMLASPVAREGEALERLGEAAWEYKIDGARVQIHKSGEKVQIFTRHLKDVTSRLPELVLLVRHLPLESAILEGETLAVGPDGVPLPFQVTMRRLGRIQDVEKMRAAIPLTALFFDVLYLNGEPLFDRPYRERFVLLGRSVQPANLIPQIITADEKTAREFLLQSLEAGHEGLVAKDIASAYKAGQRGFHWLKIKPAETLDLVVLAAEWGSGRRKGWLSNLHLGARDPESGRFVMLGKTFKGLTDGMLQWVTGILLELETHRDKSTVYVSPQLVVEVAYSGLQESSRYPGGVALRFARVRAFREDKSTREADTIQRVWALFRKTVAG